MASTISRSHVETFKANVFLTAHQPGDVLFPTVMVESGLSGVTHFAEQLGSGDMTAQTTRHGDSPLNELEHTRRQYSTTRYEFGLMIDHSDKVRMLTDPQSSYAVRMRQMVERRRDQTVIDVAVADALVNGGTGATATTTSLPSTQKVAVDFVESGSATNSGLTIGKLREANRIFGENNVFNETLHLAVAQQQLTDLLKTSEVTNTDTNVVAALVNAEIDTYVGFKFHRTQLLTLNTTTDVRTCFAYVESGIQVGVGEERMNVDPTRSDKRFNPYMLAEIDLGGTRMEEVKVVEISCDESP